jgi:hypothetical protein
MGQFSFATKLSLGSCMYISTDICVNKSLKSICILYKVRMHTTSLLFRKTHFKSELRAKSMVIVNVEKKNLHIRLFAC